LFLLLASCASLGWGLWRDDFKPSVFLGGLLLFSWGYALLWRHDVDARFASLDNELAKLKETITAHAEEDADRGIWLDGRLEMFDGGADEPVPGNALAIQEF
jgi:hypothetical protein